MTALEDDYDPPWSITNGQIFLCYPPCSAPRRAVRLRQPGGARLAHPAGGGLPQAPQEGGGVEGGAGGVLQDGGVLPLPVLGQGGHHGHPREGARVRDQVRTAGINSSGLLGTSDTLYVVLFVLQTLKHC